MVQKLCNKKIKNANIDKINWKLNILKHWPNCLNDCIGDTL